MGSHYKIRTEKTGHYFTHGSLDAGTKFVWVCLHGYGQLGKYFIQKFQFLDPRIHYVIVPEGLNRFYLEGVDDRPVATWMTREDRLDEIADYILFLELLKSKKGWDKNPNHTIIYFGFSQGATSLMRWLIDSTPRVDYLLLWAGGLPDDLTFEHRKTYFQNIPTHYFLGDKDQYISPHVWDERKSLMESMGMKVQLHQYAGDHRVEEAVLKKWVEEHLK